MKHFFAILLIVFFAVPVQGGDVPFYQTPEFAVRAKEFVAYMEKILQQNKQALTGAKTASLLEDADAYNVLSPFYLMQTDTSPLSGTRGYGDFTDLPFGKARLVSCHSGIKDSRSIFGAVQILSNRDWYFYAPDVQITSSVAQKPIVSAPLNIDETGGLKRDYYYGAMFFPIILELTDSDKPYDLTADVKIKACHKSLCDTFDTRLHLPLTNLERFPTGICPILMQVLQHTPLPPVDGTKVQAVLNNEGLIQLFFEFANEPKVVLIHTDENLPFDQISKIIKGHKAGIVIKPLTPLKEGDMIHLKAVTTQHSYDFFVPLKKGSFTPITYDFAWGSAIIGGFLLFFFTPFWALFIKTAPRFKKNVKQTGLEITLCVLSVAFLCALSYQAGLIVPMGLVQIYPAAAIFAGALLIWLTIRIKPSVLGAFLCLLVLPKPYLEGAFDTMPQGSVYPFFITFYWGLCLALPFYLMYKKPNALFKIFKIFQSTPRQTNMFARLPLIILLGWLILGAFGNAYANRQIPLYTPERLQSALDKDKVVFVSVENKVCLTCFLNKTVTLKTGYARPLYKAGRLVILRVQNGSDEAKELMAKTNQATLPLNLLFGPGNKDGLLLPAYVSYADLKKYLSGVLKIR